MSVFQSSGKHSFLTTKVHVKNESFPDSEKHSFLTTKVHVKNESFPDSEDVST